MEGGLDAQVIYDPPNLTYPYGAYIAVVDIDPDTAQVTVRRFIAVDDCGVRINPMVVEGQIHGGLAEGVGIALMELISFDEEGNCLNSSFMDYLIPTALECPDFELGETVTPCPHHPLGAKGVGESPNVGSPPAIVNAVIDALHETHGVEHIDMPCTPARVWRAMQGNARAAAVSGDEVAHLVPDIETLAQRLASVDYLVDEGLATSLFLSLRLPAAAAARGRGGRRQDGGRARPRRGPRHAARAAPVLRGDRRGRGALRVELSAPAHQHPAGRRARRRRSARRTCSAADYLIRRPLLRALEHPGPRPAVLLIDEIDRADDDFEAFLLELLADASVTIPEIGTITATHPPVIVLTSNRTRDLHDAVKRRCLYHWIEYPDARREVEIIRRRVKGAAEVLAVQVATAVARDARQRRAEAAGHRRGDRLAGRARPARRRRARRGDDRPHARRGAQVRRGPGGDPRGRPRVSSCGMKVETVWLDLPALVGAFARRLHEAGLPMTPARSADLARALELVRPVARRRLYWTARAIVVTDPSQVPLFDAVFAGVFRGYAPRCPSRHPRRSGPSSAATCPRRGAASAARSRCRWRGRAPRSGCRRSASTRWSPTSSRTSTR